MCWGIFILLIDRSDFVVVGPPGVLRSGAASMSNLQQSSNLIPAPPGGCSTWILNIKPTVDQHSWFLFSNFKCRHFFSKWSFFQNGLFLKMRLLHLKVLPCIQRRVSDPFFDYPDILVAAYLFSSTALPLFTAPALLNSWYRLSAGLCVVSALPGVSLPALLWPRPSLTASVWERNPAALFWAPCTASLSVKGW